MGEKAKVSEMKGSFEAQLSPDQDLCTETEMSQDFYKQLKLSNNLRDLHKEEEEEEEVATESHDDNDDDDDEEGEGEEEEAGGEEEFSFMCGGDVLSPIAAEDAFINGQIKAVFPLFNRDLLFSRDESDSLHENLPMKPPVKKIFVETEDSHEVTSSTEGGDEVVGPYCEWSNRKAVEVSPDVCKKSNSTGFSKLWRFKDLMGRSNSDGRDAYVFLNNNHPPPSATEAPASTLKVAVGGRKGEEKVEKEVSMAKVNRKVKKSGKTKTASLSAHEVYLRSKAKEEGKRRSYLPYRPELMGFFTNINSGLSKNVHPF